MNNDVQWQRAFAEWQALLGADALRVDAETLDYYARTSSASSTRPAAILLPASTEQVQQIVAIANCYKTPLYPISQGKNWGYGDACAVTDQQVIIDLSRMNQIIKVDRELAYTVIEPGVTQKQLSDYLLEHNIPLWMDCTGSSPYTSLIGNIMERGFGYSPYGNRFQTIANLEIVLGTGKILRTGFGHYQNARTASLYPYGIGPYFDGIFTQANFGIVTKLTLWLMPKPEAFCTFLCFIKRDEDIAKITDKLRVLRSQGCLPSTVHIGNDFRGIAGAMSFPVHELGRQQNSLPIDYRLRLRNEMGFGAWNISGALYGSKAQVRNQRRQLKKALKIEGMRLIFLSQNKLDMAEKLLKIFERLRIFTKFSTSLRAKIGTVKALAEIHSGVPTGHFLKSSYWRSAKGIPDDFSAFSDAAKDRCGIIWLAPVLPMTGSDIERFNQHLSDIFERYELDYMATFSMVNERALAAIISVSFNAEDEKESERAKQCYDAGLKALFELGYPPYRIGIQSMSMLSEYSDQEFWETTRALKKTLDPNGIIAPGRYQPQ